MKIRVLIVDDDPLGREQVHTLLMEESDLTIVGVCASGSKAVAAILGCRPDLVFLDIEMPHMCGFDVLETIPPEYMPEVIFVTAHDKYALRAFDFHALDYLLKPFDRERFQRALQRARKRLCREPDAEIRTHLTAVLESLRKKEQYRERIAVRSEARMSFVPVDEVDWIDAAGNYVYLHAGRNRFLLRETLQSLEATLDPEKFARIHRCTLVNLSRVKELQLLFRGSCNVVLHDGTRLNASARFRNNLVASLAGSLPISSRIVRVSSQSQAVSSQIPFADLHPMDKLLQAVKQSTIAPGV